MKTRLRVYGDGWIYLRGGVYWIGYYLNGNEKREPAKHADGTSIREPNESAALKFLRIRLGEIQADKMGLQPFLGAAEQRVTVGDLLDLVVQQREVKGRRNTPSFRSEMKLVRETFGDMRAVAVTEDALDKYILGQRNAGLRNATINRRLEKLRQAFRLGIRRKKIARMPVFELLREDNIREGFFEHDEFLSLRDACADEDLKDFWTFAYYIGWRKGSIEALKWTDFDLNNMLVRLRPEATKENKSNWVPLPEGVLEDLIARRWEKRIVSRKDGTTVISEYVFHRGDGKKFGDFEKAWASACHAAGLVRLVKQSSDALKEVPSKTFHDFRRTAYRNMRKAGIDKDVARTIVGHKTDNMARRYQIYDTGEKEAALTQLQAYLSVVESKREERKKRVVRFQTAGKMK
jgi:integrase